MKKIVLVTITFLFAFCAVSFSQQLLVGKLESGKPVLTADKTKLSTALKRNLSKYGINGTFTEADIKEVKGKYYLIFTGDMKAAFSVVSRDGQLFAEITVTCTTNECSSDPEGCLPMATYCTECTNKGKCTKTVSQSSLLE